MPRHRRDRLIAIAFAVVTALSFVSPASADAADDAFGGGFDAGQSARPYAIAVLGLLAVAALAWFVWRRRRPS